MRANFGELMKLSALKREALRMQFGGCCAFCGNKLPNKGWHAEFIGEEFVCGGIVAVCTECRISRGNATPEAFRSILSEQVERAWRHSANFRTALRFGLVSTVKAPVIFWFERYLTEHMNTSHSASDYSHGSNHVA